MIDFRSAALHAVSRLTSCLLLLTAERGQEAGQVLQIDVSVGRAVKRVETGVGTPWFGRRRCLGRGRSLGLRLPGGGLVAQVSLHYRVMYQPETVVAMVDNGSGNDESDSWSAPPKMSAEMNRGAAGDIHKRIHISFHSNASGGSARGTVALITSDAHEGLKNALEQALAGSSWQRCRVHFMRNLLAHIPKRDKALVAAAVRTVFVMADRDDANQQLTGVAEALQRRYPKAADLLVEAEADILAYMAFPQSHWRRIYSTNPLERLNKEVKRRTNVVGVFPDRDSVIRLVGSLLTEVDDEWQIGRRYFSQASMKELLDPEPLADAKALPMPVLPIH